MPVLSQGFAKTNSVKNVMIRTLIVDDEPLSCSRLRRLLQEDSEIEIVGECTNGKAAVEAIKKHNPDLLFLDVQMPGLNGFQVLQSLKGVRLPTVVFVTAYDQYALQAFEYFPVDYLLKPFDRARFESALRHAKDHIARGVGLELTQLLRKMQEKPSFLQRLVIRSGDRIFFLKTSEVEWIEADGNYSKVHAGSESYSIKKSLLALESSLDPHRFFRINRRTLVSLDHIRELQQLFHGDYVVILNNGTQLTLSRRYRSRAEEIFSHRST